MLNQHTLGYLQWMAARPWMMRKEELRQMVATVVRGDRLTDAQVAAAQAARELKLFGSVAIIPVFGPIMHRGGWLAEYYGLTSIQALREKIRQALANEEVKAILFEHDSPGGEVDGTPELAAEIFALRGQKPMISVVNTMQCSASHWLGAQSDEIIITPSGQAGSIGVWTLHFDESGWLEQLGIKPTLIFAGEHKVDGHPFGPLSEKAEADLQASVDEVHKDFLAAVARARGTTPAAVRAAYGEGKVYSAKQAVKLGVVDRIGTLEQVLGKLNGRAGARRADDSAWWKAAIAELPGAEALPIEVTEPEPEKCGACNGSGLHPEAYMGDPKGQEPCEECGGTGKAAAAAAAVDQAAIDRDALELAEAEADAL